MKLKNLDCSAGLVKFVQRRVVSEEVPAGTEIPGGGERRRLDPMLHCHQQNDSCINKRWATMNESRFHASLIVKEQNHTIVSTGQNF